MCQLLPFGRGRGGRGACSRCAPTRTANSELAEKTWHCCGQAGTFAIQLRLKFLLSFVRFCDMEKKAKGNGKAKANKHANKPSRVELNRVASCESRLPHRPFLWHPERGQFQKGILQYVCVGIKYTQRKPFKAKSKGLVRSGLHGGRAT